MNFVNIGRSFSILNRRSQLMMTTACEELNLSYSEYVVLICLYDAEGKSQDELASALFLDKAVVTRTIALLEKKNMIRREKDKRDKRINHIFLTESAKEQQKFLTGLLDLWISQLLAKLTETEKEILGKGLKLATEKACTITPREFAESAKKNKRRG